MLSSFYRYWGKSAPLHLVVYHCLDVAAVLHTYLRHEKSLLQRLSSLSTIPEDTFLPIATFFTAMHDLGKFSNGFQCKQPLEMQKLQGSITEVLEEERHDLVGFSFWWDTAQEAFIQRLYPEMTTKEQRHLGERFEAFSTCSFGHHGYPVRDPVSLKNQFPPQVEKDALTFVYELADLFQIRDKLISLPKSTPEVCTWLLAGAIVLADWLGSSAHWFSREGQPIPLDEYWTHKAVPQAEKAVQEAKVLSFTPQAGEAIQCLFQDTWRATPLQQLAATIPLAKGPQLYIFEEVTGAGKTEAAMILSLRLLQEAHSKGVFFSLPTMATANAMHQRLLQVKSHVFTSEPVLSLAHSQAKATQAAMIPKADEWARGSNKRAMFSQLGAGTIDQALVSILPQPHQAFRLLGLTQKVVVVDEVHATDSYMLTLLCNFLTFHATLGGSAILLSATLPKHMRQQLVDAFAEGCQTSTVPVVNNAYPLLTQISAQGLHEEYFPARFSRQVLCESLHDREQMKASIRADLHSGKCVCRLSNTIHAALSEYHYWKKEYPNVQLFHSRFTQGDRSHIEQSILQNFGPKSTESDRHGKLLIATQVVEQSLDIDFDEIYTDLAPIDLLIQRAGRLHRHNRGQRGTPCLHVLTPLAEKDVSKNWFNELFPRAEKIYPDHGQLWKTARWLQQRKKFNIPEDARDMLEYVYSEFTEVPVNLQKRSRRAEHEKHEDANEASLNQLVLKLGYAQRKWPIKKKGYVSRKTPTRLGEPCQTWRLYKKNGTTWEYLDANLQGEGNDINLPVRILYDETADAQERKIIESLKQSKEMKYKKVLLLHPTTTPGVWSGRAQKKSASNIIADIVVLYDKTRGLRLGHN